jgi:hypothetical protein
VLVNLIERKWGQVYDSAMNLVGSEKFGQLVSDLLPGVEGLGKMSQGVLGGKKTAITIDIGFEKRLWHS